MLMPFLFFSLLLSTASPPKALPAESCVHHRVGYIHEHLFFPFLSIALSPLPFFPLRSCFSPPFPKIAVLLYY
jgi:hypothetical protein